MVILTDSPNKLTNTNELTIRELYVIPFLFKHKVMVWPEILIIMTQSIPQRSHACSECDTVNSSRILLQGRLFSK